MAVGGAALAAPAVHAANRPIKWRLQPHAGPALAENVIKPSIDKFNSIANGEMVIELYTSDQLVLTAELFRAMQRGTIDALQSDDDSVSIFGGYFPLALRYSLDVPALSEQYGLRQFREQAYGGRRRYLARGLVRHHGGLHRRLGGRDQILPTTSQVPISPIPNDVRSCRSA